MHQFIFISGATSGIGFQTARALDARQYRVFAAGLPQDNFDPLINAASDRLVPLRIDITDHKSLTQITNEMAAITGNKGLVGLVNNAGVYIPGPLEGSSLEAIRAQFEVNVFGHLQVTQALLPLLRQSERPRIVNVSSIMGRVAMPMLGAYSMTKHALEGMTDVLRLELAADDIHVASVLPGAVKTPMLDTMSDPLAAAEPHLSDEAKTRYGAMLAHMGRVLDWQRQHSAVSPEQVAEAIVHALTAKRPKTRYVIGGASKGLLAMRTYAPDAMGDTVLRRALAWMGRGST